MTLLGDLMSTLFERRYAATGDFEKDGRTIRELCAALLTSHGEVQGTSLARKVLTEYARLSVEQKHSFFSYLCEELDINLDQVQDSLTAYRETADTAQYSNLMTRVQPQRRKLLRRLNQAPGATQQLVAMRKDLMKFARQDSALARVDLDFKDLFRSWFNRGFLVLRPISWDSPAQILEKIIAYEAVHAIDSWEDLRRRLQPADRRCFAFFHPSMPDEPLIFVEVALTKEVPNSIQTVLADRRDALPLKDFKTAVFYSISNCQAGLAGISFGNSLIKQVVEDLSREIPTLTQFVTLSPIPLLTRWMAEQEQDFEVGSPDAMTRLAAQYLLEAKQKDGLPYDPVARFHLNNGALVHDIHAGADASDAGRAQSAGLMVNYMYDLDAIAKNHDAFAAEKTVVASRKVSALVKAARSRKHGQVT